MSISKPMNVKQSKQGISLSGDLVFSNVAGALAEGNQFIQQHLSDKKEDLPLIINCKEMARVDSAGIALLLEWQRQFKNENKRCSFEGLSNQAKSLIEAYRLKSLLSE